MLVVLAGGSDQSEPIQWWHDRDESTVIIGYHSGEGEVKDMETGVWRSPRFHIHIWLGVIVASRCDLSQIQERVRPKIRLQLMQSIHTYHCVHTLHYTPRRNYYTQPR